MNINKRFVLLLIILVEIFILTVSNVHANNLFLSNVSLESRDPASDTVVVEFDLSWNNAWYTKINHDAVWLTFRLDNGASPTDKRLCAITFSGVNPVGSSTGTNTAIEVYVPNDKLGVFVRLADFGSEAQVSSQNLQVTVDYASCGFTENDQVEATVFGLEMVFVPQGAFYAGDFDTSAAAFNQGSSDTDAWYISNSAAISVANPSSNGYRYVSNNNTNEAATGASFTIDSDFPNGYDAFYAMKYEITEGQWVEFVNSLPTDAARSNRDLTNGSHKNSDAVKSRNTVSCSGTPTVCSTSRPYRAATYLTWMDLLAFLDWAALRPMTELEFEKMARGAVLPVAGEFAWGTTDITAAAAISVGDEDGTETITTASANANYNNTVFTGGDADNGGEHTQGALRSGIFAGSVSNKVSAGASYYGVMELSGNVIERAVTVGNASGRSFTGTHGDGVLTTTSSFEGNATNSDWPGIDATPANGVTGADGSGFRGGAFSEVSSNRLRVSDRYDAANASTVAFNDAGGRGVRTYDGN